MTRTELQALIHDFRKAIKDKQIHEDRKDTEQALKTENVMEDYLAMIVSEVVLDFKRIADTLDSIDVNLLSNLQRRD